MKKIFNITSKLPIIVNIIFTMVFIVHISFIGYGMKYPTNPEIKIYSKELKDLGEFPIVFKLCLKELESFDERYKRHGYNSIFDFFKGNLSGGKMVGWAGQKKSGGSVKGNISLKDLKILQIFNPQISNSCRKTFEILTFT